MSLENIQLRKLLKLAFLGEKERQSALRADIRDEINREEGGSSGGGDFYVPFWADAKAHVFDGIDISQSTEGRINSNPRRQNLYPQLRDGFLHWWNEERRWTNLPFKPGRTLRAQFNFSGLEAIVKVENFLTVIDGNGEEYVVYSYFSPSPALTDESARLALWLLTRALPDVASSKFRVLDLIRGNTFSLDRTSLAGDEEIEFRARFARLIEERNALRTEY